MLLSRQCFLSRRALRLVGADFRVLALKTWGVLVVHSILFSLLYTYSVNNHHRCKRNSGSCQNEACLNRLSQCVLKCVDLSCCITLSCTLTIQCFMYSLIHLHRLRVFCEVSQRDQLPVGFIAQLGVQCSDIAEVMVLNPVQAWIFSYRFISQLLKYDFLSWFISLP